MTREEAIQILCNSVWTHLDSENLWNEEAYAPEKEALEILGGKLE